MSRYTTLDYHDLCLQSRVSVFGVDSKTVASGFSALRALDNTHAVLCPHHPSNVVVTVHSNTKCASFSLHNSCLYTLVQRKLSRIPSFSSSSSSPLYLLSLQSKEEVNRGHRLRDHRTERRKLGRSAKSILPKTKRGPVFWRGRQVK